MGDNIAKVRRNGPRTNVGKPFAKGNIGRPRGSRNKVTVAMLQSAREAWGPMAEETIKRGTAHFKVCRVVYEKAGECGTCRHYENMAVPYVYGKPTQPIDIDSSKLREELEALAALFGKSVEEVERDAEKAGMAVITGGRRVA